MSTVSEELQQISRQIETLAAQRDEARKALKMALERAADLEAELELSREELHKQELDVEFLSLSHKLADTPQKLAEARATVRRMIAGVDRAIALLKDDSGI